MTKTEGVLHTVVLALGDATSGTGTPFDFVGPIISTGIVGVFLLMILFRIKIMPVWVHDEAKKEWEREREGLLSNIEELKKAVTEANGVYTQQVIPTLTRLLDSEQELLALRREQARRDHYGSP